MKKHKRHICLAWIVLICFLTGQYIVFSHQHFSGTKTSLHTVKQAQPTQKVSEKCSICDIMLHTHMAIFSDAAPAPLVSICNTQYTRQHDYKGIALILSAGRSPPQA